MLVLHNFFRKGSVVFCFFLLVFHTKSRSVWIYLFTFLKKNVGWEKCFTFKKTFGRTKSRVDRSEKLYFLKTFFSRVTKLGLIKDKQAIFWASFEACIFKNKCVFLKRNGHCWRIVLHLNIFLMSFYYKIKVKLPDHLYEGLACCLH